jgi:hypothetical protein
VHQQRRCPTPLNKILHHASALLALDDARLPWSREYPDAQRGVSFGTALGGISNAESEHTRFLKKARAA